MQKHVVVIGGGIAGTGAAYALRQRGYAVTIVEKDGRLGGRICSETAGSADVEMGAGFITKGYRNLRAFLQATGLHRQLYSQPGTSGVLRGGTINLATMGSLAGNSALSWRAKLQALPLLLRVLGGWRRLDMQAPWRAAAYDTKSAADMFTGRGGKEFLEYVVQPILNGYFYWTPEQTSQAMVLVIVKAMLLGGTQKLRGGLRQIPQKAAEGCKVLLNHSAANVHRQADGTFTITATRGTKKVTLQADGVVCATTASAVPKIIAGLNSVQKKFFESISYSSTVVFAQTYGPNQTCSNTGLAFPRAEGSSLAAVTVSAGPGSTKPLGTVKAYASGASGARLIGQTDKAIAASLTAAIEPIRSLVVPSKAAPKFTHLQRWPEALPMFCTGHFQKLRTFAQGGIENPGHALVFAGDYLGGPFMEGAFTSGLLAAERLDRRLTP